MKKLTLILALILSLMVVVSASAQTTSAISVRCRTTAPSVNSNNLYNSIWAKCSGSSVLNPAPMLRQAGPSEPPTIASGSTITPTGPFVHVSGTAAIATITVPGWCGANYTCTQYLLPTGAFTFTTGGNIASSYTATANKVVVLVYDHQTGLWYHD